MTESLAPSTSDTPPPKDVDLRDAAWARVPTTFAPSLLAREIRDPEVLLRLNPYYHFKTLKTIGPGQWRAEFENQSNQQVVNVELTVEDGPGTGITLVYRDGIKRRTIFSIEPTVAGSDLVITEDYSGTPEAERREREPEVDKSLMAWAQSLRIYLIRLQRYTRLPGWRWYIRRVWIPMKPSGRRIVWLLYLITLVEFFFFCFVVLVWWAEHRH